MPRDDLAAFFAEVSDRYGLQRFEYHSDAGATLSGHDGSECVLRPTHIASCGVTGLGYLEGAGAGRRPGGRGGGALRHRRAVGRGHHPRRGLGRRATRRPPARCWSRTCSRSTRTASTCCRRDEVSLGLRIWRRRGESSLSARSSRCTPSRPRSTSGSCRRQLGRRSPTSRRLREAADAVHEFLLGPAGRVHDGPRPPLTRGRPAHDRARSCGAAATSWPSAAPRRPASTPSCCWRTRSGWSGCGSTPTPSGR